MSFAVTCARRRRRLVVAGEAVVEDRGRPLGDPSPPDPAPGRWLVRSWPRSARRPRLPSLAATRAGAPRQGGSWLPVTAATVSLSAMSRRAPARSPFHALVQRQRAEIDRQLRERTGVSNDLGLARVDRARAVGVPRHVAGHRGYPPPPQDVLLGHLRERVRRPLQDRYRDGASVGVHPCEPFQQEALADPEHPRARGRSSMARQISRNTAACPRCAADIAEP